MDDLSYSISVLQRGFMTWIKYHDRYMVYPRSIKRSVAEPQSLMPSDVVCRLGTHVVESQSYIYKVYKWEQEEVDKDRGFVWREWSVLNFCRSPFICRPIMSQVLLCYNKVREVGHRFYISKNTLSSYIEQDRIKTDEEFMRIAVQLVTAIGYLHGRGIIHGDIKPDNVLVTQQNDIQLTDFGSVRLEGVPQYGMNSGTLAFQSPQRLKDNICSKRDDIWALGVTLWCMKHKTRIEEEQETSMESCVDYQFFWAKYKRGLWETSRKRVAVSELCWQDGEVTIVDIMKSLGMKVVVNRVMEMSLVPECQRITREELGGYEWMWWWLQRVQNGLHQRNASYHRQELIDYCKACFAYVWLEGEVDASVLYHMLHISDDNL